MSDNIEIIKNKSEVSPFSARLRSLIFSSTKHNKPLLLWNHRWEYDKNPEFSLKHLKVENRRIRF